MTVERVREAGEGEGEGRGGFGKFMNAYFAMDSLQFD